jgi:hypothetical protein
MQNPSERHIEGLSGRESFMVDNMRGNARFCSRPQSRCVGAITNDDANICIELLLMAGVNKRPQVASAARY